LWHEHRLHAMNTLDTQTMRMLESTYVVMQVPVCESHIRPRDLARIAYDVIFRLVDGNVSLDPEGRCDEGLLNEGGGPPTEGKICLGVTKTGHHAHMLWKATYAGTCVTLDATVRFVRVRRLIVEEEG